MNMLKIINNNEVKNKLNSFAEKNKISEDEVICSIVYEFASKLPYSIDYQDKEFVPGIFLNVSPTNPNKWIFKDYSSLYNKMINWGDTLKSGILLQICFIFQLMLMGEFPNNYQLTEEDYINLGIKEMTSNEEYNRYLFEMLKTLPMYCEKVNSAKNTDERRTILDEIYVIILDRVGQKIGGFRRESIKDNVINVQEYKPTIRLRPHKDLDMLYYFERIRYGFGIRSLIDEINTNFNIKTSQEQNSLIKMRHPRNIKN